MGIALCRIGPIVRECVSKREGVVDSVGCTVLYYCIHSVDPVINKNMALRCIFTSIFWAISRDFHPAPVGVAPGFLIAPCLCLKLLPIS